MTILGFIVCGVINIQSLPRGNPIELSSPIDYLGYLCGSDSPVANKPYAYYLADGEG